MIEMKLNFYGQIVQKEDGKYHFFIHSSKNGSPKLRKVFEGYWEACAYAQKWLSSFDNSIHQAQRLPDEPLLFF